MNEPISRRGFLAVAAGALGSAVGMVVAPTAEPWPNRNVNSMSPAGLAVGCVVTYVYDTRGILTSIKGPEAIGIRHKWKQPKRR